MVIRRHGLPVVCVAGMLVALQLLGCSSKGPRYPADHARYQRIDQAVHTLRTAYVEKDLARLQALLLPLDPLERLAQDAQKDFAMFAEIQLHLAIERIVVDGETIDVFIHWQGQWTRTKDEGGVRDRGHGMLRWIGTQSVLLQNVEGDLPFGMAARVQARDRLPNGP